MASCIFKIGKLESTLCDECSHNTNNGVCFDCSLHLNNSSNNQTIGWMLHQLMDPRGEVSENYRCADGFQKTNTSTKSVYVRQLSNKLVIQKNIFKYIGGISNKVIHNVSIDEEISLWEIQCYFLVFFIKKEDNMIVNIVHLELS